MEEKPLVSICIPTYNRAEYLEKCLNGIIGQDGFGDIEVVISDNCSTDNTEEIGKAFQERYNNIKYFRNKENVKDKNFPLVFQRATGSLRKLTNDTVIYRNGSIRYMLDVAEENIKKKPQIYFLSLGRMKEKKEADTLDEYINVIGINLTWIRSIALWDEDCENMDLFVENFESQMAQVPFLLDNFEKHGSAVIYDRDIMDAMNVDKKNLSYGLYKVFYKNFLGFIKVYLNENKISKDTYEELRKHLLFDFFSQWIINKEFYADKYIFSNENLQRLLEEEYREAPYYEEYKRRLKRMRMKAKIRKIIRR